MNQAELRAMADERLADALALINGERWTFAYHVTGVAVECALKSCVLARMIHTGWVFADTIKVGGRDLKVREVTARSHDFEVLIDLAGLASELKAAQDADPSFSANWGIAAKWRIDSRYEGKSRTQAEELFAAVTVDPGGVFQWLKTFW